MNAVLFSQLDVFSVDVVDSRSRYGGAPCAGEDKNRSKIANFDPQSSLTRLLAQIFPTVQRKGEQSHQYARYRHGS